MALNAAVEWDVRPTGNDANAGGFRLGAPGLDYSQQDAPVLVVTDLASSGSSTITTATGGFTSAMVGNVLRVSGGSVPAGLYEILTYTSSNAVVVDRPAAAGSGSTARVGGAMATIPGGIASAVAGNSVWVRKGTYTLANATITLQIGAAPNPFQLRGYNVTHGDLDTAVDFSNFPLIQKTAGTEPIITLTGAHMRVRNFALDGNGQAAQGVLSSGASYPICQNIKVIGCTTAAFSALDVVERCWASNCASGYVNCLDHVDSVATANTGIGFNFPSRGYALRCIAYANTGATSYGFHIGATVGSGIRHCIAYGNGSHGVLISSSSAYTLTRARNCIFANNNGYGFMYSSSGTPGSNFSSPNAYFGNVSGERYNTPLAPDDITLTVNPFVDPDGGNFALNNTAGGGAACRAMGFPGAFPGGLTTGYLDIGAAQHLDEGGGGGGGGLDLARSIVRIRRLPVGPTRRRR